MDTCSANTSFYYIEAQCQTDQKQGLEQDLYGWMKDIFYNITVDNHVLM